MGGQTFTQSLERQNIHLPPPLSPGPASFSCFLVYPPPPPSLSFFMDFPPLAIFTWRPQVVDTKPTTPHSALSFLCLSPLHIILITHLLPTHQKKKPRADFPSHVQMYEGSCNINSLSRKTETPVESNVIQCNSPAATPVCVQPVMLSFC